MDDTAQPQAAETPLQDQLADAASAFKAMRTLTQPRDESGKFASQAEETPVEESEVEAPEEGAEIEGDEAEHDATDYEDEAPEEDQAEPAEMPKSWSKEDEETWRNLPPSAQAKIAEREGQRDTAINSKFQEIANVRKDFEEKLAEANASRDKWAQDYDLLVADLSLPKPDPRAYGLGTQNYNRDAYDLALLDYEQGSQQLDSLKAQREAIRAQQNQEQMQTWQARKAEIDAQHGPTLVQIVPELTDAQKAEPAMRELVNYAISQGLEPDTFHEQNQPYITAAQLTLLAKARKFDELSKGTSRPAPKKQLAIKPGVATPRSAKKTIARKKAFERLSSENSIEAAAAAMRAAR